METLKAGPQARRIIQCWSVSDIYSERTAFGEMQAFTEVLQFALCDDGTTWVWNGGPDWEIAFAPIPQGDPKC
jgi:hypothetical protein